VACCELVLRRDKCLFSPLDYGGMQSVVNSLSLTIGALLRVLPRLSDSLRLKSLLNGNQTRGDHGLLTVATSALHESRAQTSHEPKGLLEPPETALSFEAVVGVAGLAVGDGVCVFLRFVDLVAPILAIAGGCCQTLFHIWIQGMYLLPSIGTRAE